MNASRPTTVVAVDIYLQTERLRLRRFTEADVDNLVALDSDPGVMRFLTGVPTPREVIETKTLPQFLAGDFAMAGSAASGAAQRPSHGDPRLGGWAAMERSTDEFVGWFQLRRPQWPLEASGPDDAELGYRLRTSCWGKGYGTEGTLALIDKAFIELGIERVVATTMAVNIASRRVLEKAGLRLVRTFHLSFPDPLPGTEHGEVEYALTRDEWTGLAASGGAPSPSP
jgi:RimJ/RimL family protein N-acetyltransferase